MSDDIKEKGLPDKEVYGRSTWRHRTNTYGGIRLRGIFNSCYVVDSIDQRYSYSATFETDDCETTSLVMSFLSLWKPG